MTNGWQQNTDGRFIFLPTHARSSSHVPCGRLCANYAGSECSSDQNQQQLKEEPAKCFQCLNSWLAWYGVENEIVLITQKVCWFSAFNPLPVVTQLTEM
jgi:hypothetical protein